MGGDVEILELGIGVDVKLVEEDVFGDEGVAGRETDVEEDMVEDEDIDEDDVVGVGYSKSNHGGLMSCVRQSGCSRKVARARAEAAAREPPLALAVSSVIVLW